MILSNIVAEGRPIGLADAGQDWHTDMSFSRTIAFVTCCMLCSAAAGWAGAGRHADLPTWRRPMTTCRRTLQARLETLTATHDFGILGHDAGARRRGQRAQPLTEAQRRQKPPVSQPMVLRHPLSGRRILYANPGYTVSIDGLPAAESDALLELLFGSVAAAIPLRPSLDRGRRAAVGQHPHHAQRRPDYGPDEHRLVRRCQAMADRVFDPDFARLAEISA